MPFRMHTRGLLLLFVVCVCVCVCPCDGHTGAALQNGYSDRNGLCIKLWDLGGATATTRVVTGGA